MALATGLFVGSLCIEPICRVTSSAQGIHSVMSNIYSYTTYADIINSLKKLDIEASVRILEKLVKELNVKNQTKTVEECFNLLKKCISDIENELGDIHEKLSYNRSIRYFTYFRSFKFTDSIIRLEELKNQLDNRTKMLFLILNNVDKLILRNNTNIDDIDVSVLT
jgi:hypothetical protein